MLYATLENYDLAIGDLSRVIALNPDLADAYYTRGLTYQMQGDETRSELDFQMAIQLDSSYKDRIQN